MFPTIKQKLSFLWRCYLYTIFQRIQSYVYLYICIRNILCTISSSSTPWLIEFSLKTGALSFSRLPLSTSTERPTAIVCMYVVVNNTAERAALLEWLIVVTFISQHNKKKCHHFPKFYGKIRGIYVKQLL